MREPWTDRRKQLEDVGAVLESPHVAVVPVADDAARLWALWVGQQGGEGIVLKDRRVAYRPGVRSPDCLKVEQRLTLRVRVLDGEPELVKWGDWGWAARVRLAYLSLPFSPSGCSWSGSGHRASALRIPANMIARSDG